MPNRGPLQPLTAAEGVFSSRIAVDDLLGKRRVGRLTK